MPKLYENNKGEGIYLIPTNAEIYAEVKAYWENPRTTIAEALLDATDAADRRYVLAQPFRRHNLSVDCLQVPCNPPTRLPWATV